MRVATTLGAHLGRRFLAAILAMFALTLLIIIFINYVDQVRIFFGTDRFDLFKGFLVSLMGAPSTGETVIPLAVLFASIVTLAMANRRLEFTIARTAGVSVWRFLLPGAAVAFALGVAMITVYDPVAAMLKERSIEISAEIFPEGSYMVPSTSGPFWLRQKTGDGESIIGASQSTEGGLRLAGVSAFVFAGDGSLTERLDAAAAYLEGNEWVLGDALVTPTDGPGHRVPEYRLETSLSPQQVRESLADPDTVAFWRLPGLIDIASESALPANGLRLRFNTLIQLPVLLVAMVFIAGAVSLRFSRTLRLGRMFTIGAGAGFGLYLLIEITKSFGRGGLLSPAVAAWLPAALAGFVAVTVLLYREDG